MRKSEETKICKSYRISLFGFLAFTLSGVFDMLSYVRTFRNSKKGDKMRERILEILRHLKGVKLLSRIQYQRMNAERQELNERIQRLQKRNLLLRQRNQQMQAKIEKLEKEHGLTIRGASYIRDEESNVSRTKMECANNQ